MSTLVAYGVVAVLVAVLLRLLVFPDVGRPTTYHTTLLADELSPEDHSDVIRRHDVKDDESLLAVVVRETRGREEHLLVTDRRVRATWEPKDPTFRLDDIDGWSKPEHARLVGEYRLKRRSAKPYPWFTFEVAGVENRRTLESVLIPELARHNRR